MDYTAFVPARSGSKRVKNKNIKMLAGKPLVVWTLEACIEVSRVKSVILSTDSNEYWEIVKKYIDSDKLRLDFRNHDDAGDNVKIFDYLKNKRDKIFTKDDEVFILALPTVPLRTKLHINKCIDRFEQIDKPIFSATEYGFPISFAFKIINGEWEAVLESNPMITGNTRSQNQVATYHPNGAVYVRKVKDLCMDSVNSLYVNAEPYLMSRESSIDIDNQVDFMHAEFIMSNVFD